MVPGTFSLLHTSKTLSIPLGHDNHCGSGQPILASLHGSEAFLYGGRRGKQGTAVLLFVPLAGVPRLISNCAHAASTAPI
jgi:hypothetical protein